jgi:septum site-determining protein MinD
MFARSDDSMGKVIAVTSGKGGTGKTTTVAAISSCLAALGHRTLCVDFDVELSNLDLALSMADFTVVDFKDVLDGRLGLREACHESPMITNLSYLAAPQTLDWNAADASAIARMFDEIRTEFDYCLVDSPPGIGSGFALAHQGVDMSIIVTIGEMPAMRDAQRTAEVLHDMGIRELRLLVNRVLPKNYKRFHTTIDDIIDAVGVQLLGVIREDEAISLSLHENKPLVLFRKRLAAYDFLDAALRITGKDIPLRW